MNRADTHKRLKEIGLLNENGSTILALVTPWKEIKQIKVYDEIEDRTIIAYRPVSFKVDEDALETLIHFYGPHVTAILLSGTTGESPMFKHEQQIEYVETGVEIAAGKVPIIGGCSANTTSEAIMLARGIKKAGAVAGLSVTPYYNKPSQDGLFVHYKLQAENADGLLMIPYSVPSRTGVRIEANTAKRLEQVPNIIGIKDANNDLALTYQYALQTKRFVNWSGDDVNTVPMMALTNSLDDDAQAYIGTITIAGHGAPEEMQKRDEFAFQGRYKEANRIAVQYHDFMGNKGMFKTGRPNPEMGKYNVAEVFRMCNLVIGLPMLPVVGQDGKDLEALMSKLEVWNDQTGQMEELTGGLKAKYKKQLDTQTWGH